jgi:hypothetical protein
MATSNYVSQTKQKGLWQVFEVAGADAVPVPLYPGDIPVNCARIIAPDVDITYGPTDDGDTITVGADTQDMIPYTGQSFSLGDWYAVLPAGKTLIVVAAVCA